MSDHDVQAARKAPVGQHQTHEGPDSSSSEAAITDPSAPRGSAASAARARVRTRSVSAPTVLVFVAASLTMLFLVLVPTGYLFHESLTDPDGALSGNAYVRLFTDAGIRAAATNTLLVSLGSAISSVVVGVPLAFGTSRTNMAGKGLVRASVLISLISPPFLATIAYIILLGPNAGLLNVALRDLLGLSATSGPFNVFSLFGFVLLVVPMGAAFVYVQAAPAFEAMDPSLEEAARMSGADKRQTALRITLPVMRHAILSGGLLVFSISLALYGIPHLLGMDYLTISIREALFLRHDFSLAAAIAGLLVALAFIALFLYRRAVRSQDRYQVVAGRGFRPGTMDLGGVRHLFTGFGVGYAVLAFLLPYGTLVLMSLLRVRGHGVRAGNFTLEHYRSVLSSPGTRQAIYNSLVLASVAATIVVVIGVVVGYLISRTTVSGRWLLDYVAMIPLGIAGTAFAAGLVIAYLQAPLNAFPVYGTLWILLLAYATRFLPYGVRLSQVGLVQLSRSLEEAARMNGATWLQSMRHVTLPLIKNSLIYAWILVLVQAFPEISASIMLVGPGTGVVSTAILDLWGGTGGLPRASALGVVVFVAVTLLVGVGQKLLGGSALNETKP